MNNKALFIIVALLVILLLGIQQYVIWNAPEKKDPLIEKIIKLESKLDSIKNQKDSIRTIIDSTHVKIITNEKHYQERVNTIISEPDSFSESFARQYLRDYASTRGYRIIGASEIK